MHRRPPFISWMLFPYTSPVCINARNAVPCVDPHHRHEDGRVAQTVVVLTINSQVFSLCSVSSQYTNRNIVNLTIVCPLIGNGVSCVTIFFSLLVLVLLLIVSVCAESIVMKKQVYLLLISSCFLILLDSYLSILTSQFAYSREKERERLKSIKREAQSGKKRVTTKRVTRKCPVYR